MQGKVNAGEVGCACLRGVARLLHCAANSPPKVGLPACLALQLEVAIAARSRRVVQGTVLRYIVAAGRSSRGNGREQGSPSNLYLVMGRKVSFGCLAKVLIVCCDPLFESIALGILVDLPPLALQQPIRWIRRLPAATGWIRGRDDGS